MPGAAASKFLAIALIALAFPLYAQQAPLQITTALAPSSTPQEELPNEAQLTQLSLSVLTAALEQAVLENTYLQKQLEDLRARDAALGLTALSGSTFELQERAISLLREVADLREENTKLRKLAAELSNSIQTTGANSLQTAELLTQILTEARSTYAQNLSIISTDPLRIQIIAKDAANGWFIANAGWEQGVTEGMLYRFDKSDGTTGRLRVIESRKSVSALVPQIGGSVPDVGQMLTLETR